MSHRSQIRKTFRVLAVLGLLGGILSNTNPARAQWPQWGGPNRNFTADTKDLAEKWPDAGPKQLWKRSLGTGYAGLAVAGGAIYTMYRTSNENKLEYTIALDAATGNTLWKNKQFAPVPESVKDYGKQFSGPNSTPLVVGDRVYTVGRNATLQCLQAADGKLLWKHELKTEFGAETHTCGFSTSPIAFGDTIILSVGRLEDDTTEGRSLIAFDQKTGDVAWKNQTFSSWHSSPILIKYLGKQQLLLCTNSALIGVDPSGGALQWKYEYPDLEQFEGIWTSPVWDGKDTILFSSRKAGCAVQLAQQDSKTVATKLWIKRNNPFGMGTPILLNDILVGAKRGQNASFIGVDIRTGKNLWFKRVFPGATLVGDTNKLIILDSNGQLAMATANRQGLNIVSQTQLTEKYSFTAPALVGTTLFVRDEKTIMALDLSIPADKNAG